MVHHQYILSNYIPDVSLRLAPSKHLNVEPLSREHSDTQTEKDTEPTIYRSQHCDTRSGLRADKIKDVVTVYNKTIKRSCFILSYHIVIKDLLNSFTKALSHNVYSLSLKLLVRYVYYN